ncbi:hypothetical protein [Bacillus mycoides]|uniref:hypothetical protein n=1 Tax=Bacillus mycoides TaxID=1405 RepID=UPI001C03181E|nr:hypothetical protein [Bacillus mycoides]QWH77288.1 hypothetical protein EXW59_11605 [Bacillus mycoides]QWI42337.1 hypothetical protein EXW55_04865 [Bacillus mycoides]
MVICGREHDVQCMEFLATLLVDKMKHSGQEELMQFKADVYQTYVIIRNVHNPQACKKMSLQAVKDKLNDEWLQTYCKLSREDAEKVIYFAEMFSEKAIR